MEMKYLTLRAATTYTVMYVFGQLQDSVCKVTEILSLCSVSSDLKKYQEKLCRVIFRHSGNAREHLDGGGVWEALRHPRIPLLHGIKGV